VQIQRPALDLETIVSGINLPMIYLQDAGSTAIFTGETSIGMRAAHLTLGPGIGSYDSVWYLYMAAEPSNSDLGSAGHAVMALSTAPDLLWFEGGTLLQRRGSLHLERADHGWDIWTAGRRAIHNVSSRVTGKPWKMDTSGVDFGADKLWMLDSGARLYTGLMAGYLGAHIDMQKNGGDGDIDGGQVGLYATLLTESGWYVDWVARGAYLSHKFMAIDSSFTRTSASYQNAALGTSLEIGHKVATQNGWFAEPSVQASYVHFTGARYTTGHDNVFDVQTHGRDVSRFRAGSLFGHTFQLNTQREETLQLFVKIFGVEQVSTRGGVSTLDGKRNADFDGSSLVLGAGMVLHEAARNQISLGYEAEFSKKCTVPVRLNFQFSYRC